MTTARALFGGTTSFLDTGEGLEERLATLASRDDDRRAQEELKAALLEAAQRMQAAQEQPLKVELHSTLELDGAVLAPEPRGHHDPRSRTPLANPRRRGGGVSMAWNLTLQDASFRGVTFDVQSVEDRGEKALCIHEYPYRPGPR